MALGWRWTAALGNAHGADMKLLIATPAYDGRLHHGYVHALIHTVDVLREHGHDVCWLTVPGQSLLPATHRGRYGTLAPALT